METGLDDRRYWVGILEKIARPVLEALAARELKKRMPLGTIEGLEQEREQFTHLEALGRVLAGIGPWLDVETMNADEARLKTEFATLAREGIKAGTDPDSRDFMNFTVEEQPIVDAAFLAQGILRAPTELWEKLDVGTRKHVVNALKSTRSRRPFFNNHLLFAGTIEAMLCKVGEEWDPMRVDFAMRQHEQWYLGDGMYADGPEFHWDYYNSFVIHPMLIDILDAVSARSSNWEVMREPVMKRAARHAEVLERMISPEGTFPPIGRSLTYRFAAFHLLGQMALLKKLPERLAPAQVRCALTAVIRRQMETPGTFDKNGWLLPGFCGHQPSMSEFYISTGSLYQCMVGLLPLGLAESDEFWSAPAQDWTAKQIWSGKDSRRDHAM